jgi:hypothetical protein
VTKQAQQIWMLAGLFSVLGGVVTYQMWPADTATSSVAPSNSKDATAVASSLPVAKVNLDRLQASSESTAAPARDPFRFKPKPVPPVAGVKPRLPIVGPNPAPPPPPPPPDSRPEIQMKYLGYVMSPAGTRMAILQDNANHPPVTGKQGDVIDGRYRLLRVDAGEVEISYLDGGRRRRIVKGQ